MKIGSPQPRPLTDLEYRELRALQSWPSRCSVTKTPCYLSNDCSFLAGLPRFDVCVAQGQTGLGEKLVWEANVWGGLLFVGTFFQEGIRPRRLFDSWLVVRWLLSGGFLRGGF